VQVLSRGFSFGDLDDVIHFDKGVGDAVGGNGRSVYSKG
jgi:hypothetical protein